MGNAAMAAIAVGLKDGLHALGVELCRSRIWGGLRSNAVGLPESCDCSQ